MLKIKFGMRLVASNDQKTNERNVEKESNKVSQENTLKYFIWKELEEILIQRLHSICRVQVLRVEHIDKETGNVLKEDYQSGGEIGKVIKTGMNFDNYVLIESPRKSRGCLKEEEQIVNYYSRFYDINVKYIDINNNKEIIHLKKMNKRINSEYATDKKMRIYFVKVVRKSCFKY